MGLGVLAPYSLADHLTVDCRRLPPTVAEVYTLAIMLALHRRYPQLRYPPPPPSPVHERPCSRCRPPGPLPPTSAAAVGFLHLRAGSAGCGVLPPQGRAVKAASAAPHPPGRPPPPPPC